MVCLNFIRTQGWRRHVPGGCPVCEVASSWAPSLAPERWSLWSPGSWASFVPPRRPDGLRHRWNCRMRRACRTGYGLRGAGQGRPLSPSFARWLSACALRLDHVGPCLFVVSYSCAPLGVSFLVCKMRLTKSMHISTSQHGGED